MTFNVIHWNWNTPQPQPHGWWLYTNKLVIHPHLKDPNRLQKQHQQKKWLHNIISHHFPRVCNGTRGGHPFGSSSLSGTVVRRDSNLIMLSSFRSSNFICVWTNSENVSGNGIMSETFSSGGCDRRKLEIGNEWRFTLGWFASQSITLILMWCGVCVSIYEHQAIRNGWVRRTQLGSWHFANRFDD